MVNQTGSENFLLAGLIMGGVGSLTSAYSNSEALKSQGDYQKTMADINSKLSAYNAEVSIQQGDQAASAIDRKTRQIQGKQRAAFAAQGINPDTGSAAAVLSETQAMGKLDELTVKNNAWRSAWGFQVESANTKLQGTQAQEASQFASRNTLITGGLNAVGQGMKIGYISKKPKGYDPYAGEP